MKPAPQTLTAAGLGPCRQPRSRSAEGAGSRGQGKAPGAAGDHANSRGAVTAEFAVTLPGVLLLLAMLLAGSAAGITQLRLEDAARAGARALARGEDPAAVDGIVRKLAGPSASSAVVAGGEWRSVTVSDRVAGPVGRMVPWTLTARAEARSETAASAPSPDAAQAVQAAPAASAPSPDAAQAVQAAPAGHGITAGRFL